MQRLNERVYALEGGHNLRDMGGYRAADGRTVAWGRLFRSGTLSHLTPGDRAILAPLGIRLICDLRSTEERSRSPSRWEDQPALELLTHDYHLSVADLNRNAADPDTSVEAIRATIFEIYRELPYEQAESYGRLLHRIADNRLPALFHCSAGKDRTGVAGALILSLLGVDRSVIDEDYALTNDHLDRLVALYVEHRRMFGFEKPDPAKVAPMLAADPAYLEAMFETVKRRHGSIEAYADEILGLSARDIVRIREALLE